ncbi:MAG: hypothetical protein K1X94_22445 [Sandaracinaceae bacterium]|nr:hypothetical protein [Sandaracinaceae bacterium]
MRRARVTHAAALAAMLAAPLASGCAQNALFELYVELPPPTTIGAGARTASFARVLALPFAVAPGTTFDGSGSRLVPLVPGTSHQWLGVTLARDPGFMGRDLTVRVIYCEDEASCEPGRPELWVGQEDLVFRSAFYVGRTTCYAHPLPDADLSDGLTLPSQLEVPVCEVGGCNSLDFRPGENYCDLSGQHFCAGSTSGDVCDRLYREHMSELVEL